jgi:Protein of unknown function (DUF3078)
MKKILTLLAFSCFLTVGLFAQAPAEVAKMEPTAWKRGGGLGFDLTGLGIQNPRVGAGLNRIGIGGLGTYSADKKGAKNYWENNLSLQLGVLRIGGKGNNVQKGIDVLRGTSKAGRAITSSGKIFASAILIGTTSILKTYEGNLLGKDGTDGKNLVSRLFSPAQIQFHPGIEWRPNDHFGLLVSPVGFNGIFVPDAAIAKLNIHGNELGKKERIEIVPALQANYKNKFFKDKVAFTSSLNLTTNYLKQPFVITALNFWQNNVSIALGKGLSLDLLGELAYNHYKPVVKDTYDAAKAAKGADGRFDPGTITAPAKDGQLPSTTGDALKYGTQAIGSFLLKYSIVL